MRFFPTLFLCTGLVFICVSLTKAEDAPAVKLTSDVEKLSYALGLDLGNYFKGLGQDLDLKALAQGINDTYYGNKLLLTKEEAVEVQQQFAQIIREKKIKEVLAIAEKNREAAENFLLENKERKEVVATDSGLQYEILEPGGGAKPGAEDSVTVHYRGTLLDGTEFDSSYARNEPVVFQANQVIPGWSEALSLMHQGAKWKLFVPPDLAYGDRGVDKVQPGSLLIFEVELLDVAPPVQEEKAKADGSPE